jgi:hypothetical protein
VPYLTSMITLTQMTSKAWPGMRHVDTRASDFDIKELHYLDYQVENWHRSLPDELRYDPISPLPDARTMENVNERLRVLLYFRANQTRILIGRPVLLSTDAILGNLDYADSVINVARETIRLLGSLHQTTELYSRQQLLYNYFLVSALTAIFLAVAHAPAQYSTTCREEFYMALDLVRGLSANSFVGKRLWKTIKALKAIGPKIGLSTSRATGADAGDAHSNAAVAMAGLAGHSMDKFTAFGIGFNCMPLTGESWDVMADDLTNLYEAAEQNGPIGQNDRQNESDARDDVLFVSGQDQLARVFRDLF